MCRNIIETCKRGGTLVWDGDSFNKDSFTIAVLLVRKRGSGPMGRLCLTLRAPSPPSERRRPPSSQVHSVCPDITLAAFSREGEKDRVLRSWKQRLEVRRPDVTAARTRRARLVAMGTPRAGCRCRLTPGALFPSGCRRPTSHLRDLRERHLLHRTGAPHSPRNAFEDGARPRRRTARLPSSSSGADLRLRTRDAPRAADSPRIGSPTGPVWHPSLPRRAGLAPIALFHCCGR